MNTLPQMRCAFLCFTCLTPAIDIHAGEWILEYGEPLVQEVAAENSVVAGYIWNMVWDAEGVGYLGQDTLWRWDGTWMKKIGPDHLRVLKGMVFDDEGQLWLGSLNEIGVFDPESHRYQSRLDWIPEGQRAFGQVWELYHDGSSLWMGTDHQLFRVNEGAFKSWSFPGEHRIIFHFLESGVYAHQAGIGLWRLEADEMVLLCDDTRLAERSVIFLEDQPDGTLLGVSGRGVFQLEGSEIRNFHVYLEDNTLAISSAFRINPETLVLGTLGDGIKFVKKSPQGLNFTSLNLGKENLFVINLVYTPWHNLWILETSGISQLNIGLAASGIINNKDFPEGIIQDLTFSEDDFLLNLDTGVFKISKSNNNVGFINYTENESSKTQMHEGRLYYDNYDKLMVVSAVESELFHDFGGEIRTFAITPDNLVHVSFNDRLSTYRIEGGAISGLVGEYETLNSVTFLETDSLGQAWGWSHRSPLLEIGTGGSGINRYDVIAGRDMFSENHLFAIGPNGPVLVFEDALVRRSADTGEWEKADFNPGTGRLRAITFASDEDQLRGWAIYWDDKLAMSLMVEIRWPQDQPVEWEILPWLDMNPVGQVVHLEYVEEADPFFIIGGMRGLIFAAPSVSEQIPLPGRPLIWEGVEGIFTAVDRTLEFGSGSRRYGFSSPLASHYYPVRYQTRIAGMDDEWSQPSVYPSRETGQLLDGDFFLQVRGVDPFGRTGPVAEVGLVILPPWYETIWARSLMVGVACLAVLAFILLYNQRLRRRQLELEFLVGERTRELEEANEFKDLFIANLSHEIRNPLNGVIGMIRLLKPGQTPPGNHLDALQQAAGYLRNTVEDVLDFSKLQSGEITVDENEVNLSPAVKGVVEIYRQQALDKQLSLETRINVAEGTVVVTDERKLQQILGNLVSNAIKFTAAGEISLQVSLEWAEPNRGQLHISVVDTGPGITPAEQRHIFEKFYRVKSSGTRTSGTGLGLALVKGYVNRLGGSVRVESTQGKGSRFSVVLPVSRVQAKASPSSTGSAMPETYDLRVLVVEDTEYNRIFMEDLLGGLGCRVDMAEDGLAGLEMARSNKYRIIFLDWDLPGMNGLEITRQLRETPDFDQSIIIVGITAFATLEVRSECLEAGMDAFLTKPLKLPDLKKILRGEFSAEVERQESFGLNPDRPTDELESSYTLITGQGLLGEMSSGGDWSSIKQRWLGIFHEHQQALGMAVESGDTREARRLAHKLLGHLRMIDADNLASTIQDLLTAAHAGDQSGVSREWMEFQGQLEQFLNEYECL